VKHDPALVLWLDLFFRLRVDKQVLIMANPRGHSDLRTLRTHSKKFEIWRLSKSLLMYPEGYRIIPKEEFQGLDGTAPSLDKELLIPEMEAILHEWLQMHKDTKFLVVHDGEEFWRNLCGITGLTATSTITDRELAFVFDVETGEKEHHDDLWPKRLNEFLDNLSPEEKTLLKQHLDGAT